MYEAIHLLIPRWAYIGSLANDQSLIIADHKLRARCVHLGSLANDQCSIIIVVHKSRVQCVICEDFSIHFHFLGYIDPISRVG